VGDLGDKFFMVGEESLNSEGSYFLVIDLGEANVLILS
jgi:hypothetical protein